MAWGNNGGNDQGKCLKATPEVAQESTLKATPEAKEDPEATPEATQASSATWGKVPCDSFWALKYRLLGESNRQ